MSGKRPDSPPEAWVACWRVVIDRSPVGLVLAEASGRIIAANPAASAVTGRPKAQLLTSTTAELLAPGEAGGAGSEFPWAGPGDRRPVGPVRRYETPAGTTRHVLASSSGVPDPLGGPDLVLIVLEDVTSLVEARRAQGEAEERLRAVLDRAPLFLVAYDAEARITFAAGSALDLLLGNGHDLVGVSLWQRCGDEPLLAEGLTRSLAGERATFVTERGGRHWEWCFEPVRDQQGRVAGGLDITIDATERVEAEAESRRHEALFKALVGHLQEEIIVVGTDMRALLVSGPASRVLGISAAEVADMNPFDLVHPDDRPWVEQAYLDLLGTPASSVRLELRIVGPAGQVHWIDAYVTNLLHDPAVKGMVVNARDITSRKEIEDRLAHLSVHDPLTGLPNRLLFLERLQQSLARIQRSGGSLAVLFCDIDGFKAVNDSLGHAAGDRLLQLAAARLTAAARAGDTLARLGGDEFGVLCEDAGEDDARAAAERLARSMQAPFHLGGNKVSVTLSVGMAMGHGTGASPADLLSDADSAMYAAKVRGRHDIALFDETMRARQSHRRALAADVRHARVRGQLRAAFQPVVGLPGGEPVGAEALVRWQHPDDGLLAPNEFVHLAEEIGSIDDIGDWLLQEACQLCREARRLRPGFTVSINLSGLQLAGHGAAENIGRALAERDLPPDALVVDVTETVLMTEHPLVLSSLRSLTRHGTCLAVDDFGTGQSSTRSLRRLSVGSLKVDRTFVGGLERDADDRAVVESTVAVARALGLCAVAEGVETEGQRDGLVRLGFDAAQGFWWSRPLAREAFLDWLALQPVG